MVSQEPFTALWMPGWYGSDQPIEVGQTACLWFYKESVRWLAWTPPVGYPLFVNEDSHSGGLCYSLWCSVLEITHSRLGAIRAVEVGSLDLVFVLMSGERIYVDSEEEPGRAYDPPRPDISDWSLVVRLQPVA